MAKLSEIIRDRHSTRGSFDPNRPIARPQLKQILEAARWAPTPNNMQNFEIVIVDKSEQLEAIGKIPAEMSSEFLCENYDQLSFSEDELRIRKKGQLASTFPPAWTSPQAWSGDSDATSQLTFLGSSVQQTPLLLVVVYDGSKRAPGSKGDTLGQMSLGCVLENMWLTSESLGIEFHVLTVFSDGPVERQVKSILQIPPHMKVAFACSLGYPLAPQPHYVRVRRDLEDFVHDNRFDQKDIVWSSSKKY
jgi:nitroreductase